MKPSTASTLRWAKAWLSRGIRISSSGKAFPILIILDSHWHHISLDRGRGNVSAPKSLSNVLKHMLQLHEGEIAEVQYKWTTYRGKLPREQGFWHYQFAELKQHRDYLVEVVGPATFTERTDPLGMSFWNASKGKEPHRSAIGNTRDPAEEVPTDALRRLAKDTTVFRRGTGPSYQFKKAKVVDLAKLIEIACERFTMMALYCWWMHA